MIKVGDILIRNRKLDKDFDDARINSGKLPIVVKNIGPCESQCSNIKAGFECCLKEVCPGRINRQDDRIVEGCYGHTGIKDLMIEVEPEWDE